MPAAAPRLTLSPTDFLGWESSQDGRHEYHRGEVFAMAGGTETHARIITNLVLTLGGALRGSGCTVYTEALRVRVEAEDLFTYPDLSVVCGGGTFYDARRTTLLDPAVLVRVLSPSTEQYDRTTKWRFYRQISALQAYVLVGQDAPAVDVYSRDGDGWRVTSEAADGTVAIPMPVGPVTVGLGDVYDGVAFPESLARPGPPRSAEL